MKKIILGLMLISSSVWAVDFGKCNLMFPKNQPPQVVNKGNFRPLCFDSFAVLYSVDTKTPIFVVEKLNYLRLGSKTSRTNHFHEEPMLKPSERSTLKDYNHSGYDRGHMAPAADMPNSLAMEQSFSLANMVPQSGKMNRGIWAKSVEKATRSYVEKRSKGDVYVFTGPYYIPGKKLKTIGSQKVAVPDYLFKLVYDGGTGKSWVYFLENTDEVKMSAPTTYEELVKKVGIKFLNN